ncbi:hypothetical protein SUSAZ_06235 [Sulfolobus acidocaldarius SUSAZ]|nr:hypothetical protein SUSAZ_06235 [Sulfolobus acidocaldarius SUSAZ]
MSILDQEEFQELNKYKGKLDVDVVRNILEMIEDDYRKSNNILSSTIYAYSENIQFVKQNKAFFDLLLKILQKYANKIGLENVSTLIITVLS